jgi:diadenosine tetraphosphate (Ap4A) HIT family hydrolase
MLGAIELASNPVPGQTDCPFCKLPSEQVWADNTHARAFFDRYPVSDGHTLVIPARHTSSIFAISAAEYAALWALVAELRDRLRETHAADAFNVGVNER